MFLTKAVVVAISILALVQLIAATEVCYLDSDLASLPEDVRRLLAEDSHRLDSLRCPYSRCRQRGRDLRVPAAVRRVHRPPQPPLRRRGALHGALGQ